ncbi:hypothetical protein TSUD_31320 [Trifolium subterraneum]|uniref:C2H2-type domain-containing protein n=1 Tax=Trifolium subterraneum TaxID=3900 RepID=A0A2Z6N3K1_TRISU|nr:hypothetical protein TSUD_31320 [Trifolium subterraneum]
MESSLEQHQLSLGSMEHTNYITKGKGSKLVIRGIGARAWYNMYECTTCNKVFSKFQALGGHITSHKKASALEIAQDDGNNNSSRINNKYKLHECSICGSEYTSGQALGGHMTCHRAPVKTATSLKPMALKPYKPRKKRHVLPLNFDLNLPAAPGDEKRESKFAFANCIHATTGTNKSCIICTILGEFSLL